MAPAPSVALTTRTFIIFARSCINFCATREVYHRKMAKLYCVLNCVALILCYFSCFIACQSQTNHAQETASYLYDAIRKVAFPQSPKLDEDQPNVDNRFILMMPGKVLNYFDYYPGQEYTELIQVCATMKVYLILKSCMHACDMLFRNWRRTRHLPLYLRTRWRNGSILQM